MNWVLAGSILLLVIVAVFSGYFVAVWRMRRISGGKTPAELQQELDDYRNQVSEHFAESAQLLGKMTEQYREVYSHIARGSHKLGTGEELPPRAEQLRAKLVSDDSTGAAADAEAPDSNIESQDLEPADNDRSESSSEQSDVESDTDNQDASEAPDKTADVQSRKTQDG